MAKKKEQEHPLTPKQEAFALAYVETGNAAEAYRRAYDVKAATQHSSIYVAASRLLDNPKVMLRVEELQKQAAEMCLYTVRDAYTEYEVARQLALQTENPSAAVAAVKGKVALFGLEAPARNKVDHTSSDGTMTPQGIPDDLRAALDAIAGKISSGNSAG
jgi:phage terminase small subunit